MSNQTKLAERAGVAARAWRGDVRAARPSSGAETRRVGQSRLSSRLHTKHG